MTLDLEYPTNEVSFNTEFGEIYHIDSGVTDHADLTGRDKDNQHPISAITNLQRELDIRRKIDEEFTAEEVLYQNPNLQDKSGTVAAALDEAIGFVVAELPNLVAEKHSHANKGILDKFGENESGEPIYNGKTISTPEKPFVTISGTILEHFMPISNLSNTVSLYLYNNTYEGHEIKNLWFNIDGTKIDVKNLSALDGIPYIINMDKLIMSPNNGTLHVITLCAPNIDSNFIANLGAYVNYEFELEIYL